MILLYACMYELLKCQEGHTMTEGVGENAVGPASSSCVLSSATFLLPHTTGNSSAAVALRARDEVELATRRVALTRAAFTLRNQSRQCAQLTQICQVRGMGNERKSPGISSRYTHIYTIIQYMDRGGESEWVGWRSARGGPRGGNEKA